jgi:hypothetical protein
MESFAKDSTKILAENNNNNNNNSKGSNDNSNADAISGAALQRLNDVLRPYYNDGSSSIVSPDASVEDDAIADHQERDRQMQQLHKTIYGLKVTHEKTFV